MKTLCQKLKSKAGESLAEALAAILIFTLSTILLLTTVTASSNIHTAAKELQLNNQVQVAAIQMGREEEKNGTAVARFSLNGVPVASVNVDIYGGKDDDGIFAYFLRGFPEEGP